MSAAKIPLDRIAAYVRMHRASFGDDAIRAQLLKQGVSEEDIVTAFKMATAVVTAPVTKPPVPLASTAAGGGYEAPTAPPVAPPAGRSFVLVVDDEPAHRALVEERFSMAGFLVTTAADAAECVIQARAVKLSLIVSDFNMPGFGTGADALKRLRADHNMPKNLPVIFVTGSPLPTARASIGYGDPYVRVMSKPVDWKLLRRYVLDLTGVDKPL